MPKPVGSTEHLYIFDRLRGTYVDAGPASKVDRFLVHLSGGRMRIAEPRLCSGAGVAATPTTVETKKPA